MLPQSNYLPPRIIRPLVFLASLQSQVCIHLVALPKRRWYQQLPDLSSFRSGTALPLAIPRGLRNVARVRRVFNLATWFTSDTNCESIGGTLISAVDANIGGKHV